MPKQYWHELWFFLDEHTHEGIVDMEANFDVTEVA